MAIPQGYKCEFLESVPEDFYCKKCALVARRLVMTECCGESYCHSCITQVLDQAQPCPACGEDNFTVFQQKKYNKRINNLQVYCTMKERGCGWSGPLEQLDTHLSPHQDNCQYVDISCPLHCQQTVPKNMVDHHVGAECAKRPHVCQYCSFRATYEEVVDHVAQCKYVPLDCPNRCGVTFEQDFLEDHMKMCRLEEVACEFRGVGCDGRFLREDQENHARENSDKHLTLTAALAVETKDSLLQKLLDQDKRHKEEEQKLSKMIKEQQQQLTEQREKLHHSEEENMKLRQQLQDHGKKLMAVELGTKSLEKVLYAAGLNHSFVMTGFSKEKLKDKPGDWKSPAMYTHISGYKFYVGVDANGSGYARGKSIGVNLWAMPGQYDHLLKWPARVTFTLEVINQHGKNAVWTTTTAWDKLTKCNFVCTFNVVMACLFYSFMEHSDIPKYLTEDSLYFILSKVEVLSQRK